jgi:Mg-chelatase subunit ChlD
MAHAIGLAEQQMLKYKQFNTIIVLLTDGNASDEPESLSAAKAFNKVRP